MIQACECCKFWHGEFLCACPESEYYHNCRTRGDWCEKWAEKGTETSEEALPKDLRLYYHGMRNAMEDLILAVRESDEPLCVDLLEKLKDAALQAVLDKMLGGE